MPAALNLADPPPGPRDILAAPRVRDQRSRRGSTSDVDESLARNAMSGTRAWRAVAAMAMLAERAALRVAPPIIDVAVMVAAYRAMMRVAAYAGEVTSPLGQRSRHPGRTGLIPLERTSRERREAIAVAKNVTTDAMAISAEVGSSAYSAAFTATTLTPARAYAAIASPRARPMRSESACGGTGRLRRCGTDPPGTGCPEVCGDVAASGSGLPVVRGAFTGRACLRLGERGGDVTRQDGPFVERARRRASWTRECGFTS